MEQGNISSLSVFRWWERVRMSNVDFVEEPFEVEIKNGNAILTRPDGVRRAMPLHVFRMDVARGVKALAEYDARNADVIPIKRKRGAH